MIGPTPFGDCPALVISHWDLDHYRLLFSVGNSDFKMLNEVFVSSETVSVTSQTMLNVLQKNCSCPIHIIHPASKTSKSRSIGMQLETNINSFCFLKGEKSASTNLSGLALIVNGKDGIALLTADHSYSQIYNNMLPHLQSISQSSISSLQNTFKNIYMVVPHHGGYGKKLLANFSFGNLNFPHKLQKAIVSTGTNPYNHPLKSVRQFLVNEGFVWERTDVRQSDIDVLL